MFDAKILVGDVRDRLREVADGSIRTCVTSPPYWGLRDYGHDGQIGLEDSVTAYVDELVAVFREVRRVLADDGTLWLNLGDSYAGASLSRASNNGRAGFGNEREGTFSRLGDGLKQKDLIGVPWRVAFALQADGWYLRQDIIWSKPNPMPESVTDRCTKAHEYVFLLSKSPKYFFDNEAIKEPLAQSSISRLAQDINNQPGSDRAHAGGKSNGPMKAFGDVEGGRNRRSVWNIGVASFKDAHFAVMPEALAEPCVLAGSAPGDTVLDPFSGAATVGIVATRNQRHYIGCELNPDYASLSEKRLIREGGMFANVLVDEGITG
jgi:DNA modification methylase